VDCVIVLKAKRPVVAGGWLPQQGRRSGRTRRTGSLARRMGRAAAPCRLNGRCRCFGLGCDPRVC